jgi:hypothetical protein
VGRERERGRPSSQRTHGSAATTPKVRRAIQASDEKNTVLAKQYRIHRQTVAKWKARDTPFDARMGPKHPRSSVLTLEDEAIILAYRWRTRLSLNESLVRLRCLMPQLSRCALYRCLKRHGLSKIGSTAKCPPLTSAALGPYCFEITAVKIDAPNDVFAEVPPVFLAVEDATREVYAQVATTTPKTAAAFLDRLVTQFPQKINKVTTVSQRTLFTYWEPMSGGNLAADGRHGSRSPAAPTGSSTLGSRLKHPPSKRGAPAP